MAMVLLGIAAAGVLLPFSRGAEVQAEGRRVTLAAQLADDLMERIVATPPSEIVQNIEAYNCTETQGQVTDAHGAAFTDPMYAKFSRSVTCFELYVPQQLQSGTPPPEPYDFLLVDIHVCYEGREMARLSRWISK
jgi:hypothetical protein